MDDTSSQPGTQEPQTTSARGGSTLWLIMAVFLLLVIYPLSIGPAAIIHQKHPAARPAIEVVYKPVTALVDHSPRAQTLLLWYMQKVWRFPLLPPQSPTAPTNSVPVSGK